MIKPIDNLNLKVNNVVRQGQHRIKSYSDNVSFTGNPLTVVISQNPENAKALAYIGLNNVSKKTKNIFSKMCFWFFKKMLLCARPDNMLYDKNFKTVLALDGNIIKGGLLTRYKPDAAAVKCYTLAIDSVNQGKKEQLKTFFELGKTLCSVSEKEGVRDISWGISTKNKRLINLFKKFAFPVKVNSETLEFSTSVERMKEFLSEISKKHQKILA